MSRGIKLQHLMGIFYMAGIFLVGGCRPGETDKGEGSAVKWESAVQGELAKISPRKPTGLKYRKAGFTYTCMECHSGIKAKWHYERPMIEHTRLELRHGTNSFCLNCHHPENRDLYVHYDGSEIPADSVELLCRKCHGPQYRDWQAGIHGRVNGYWKAEFGQQEKLICTQCHDPHDPAFKPMEPMPAPTYPARASGKRIRIHEEEPVTEEPHG